MGNDINASKIDKLSRGIEAYQSIMKWRNSNLPLNDTIRRRYVSFYKLRWPPDVWKNEYFRLLEQWRNDCNEHTFCEAIEAMTLPNCKVEASFCSKLIHTLNPSMPIYDSTVCKFLMKNGASNVKIRPKLSIGEKKKEAVEKYDHLCDWYSAESSAKLRKDLIALFDEKFPNIDISDVKKTDFAIWSGLY